MTPVQAPLEAPADSPAPAPQPAHRRRSRVKGIIAFSLLWLSGTLRPRARVAK